MEKVTIKTEFFLNKIIDRTGILYARLKGVYFFCEMHLRVNRRRTIEIITHATIAIIAVCFSIGHAANAFNANKFVSYNSANKNVNQSVVSIPTWNAPPAKSSNLEHSSILVDLSQISGRKIVSLNAWYLGIKGEAQKTANIDFAANLQKMWERKLRIKGVSGATKDNAQIIVDRYISGSKTKMSISGFVENVETNTGIVQDNLDWNLYCNNRNLGHAKCSILKKISARITGEHIVAYAMTELMPNRKDGRFNAALLDTLLQNAGVEYVDAIPAVGDTLASLGAWQFTSYAVREDENSTEGASLVNTFLKEEYQIPGSVVLLEKDDHQRAAYMFAIFNISNLLRLTNDNEAEKLLSIAESGHMDTIAQFMAAAHHQPAYAIERTRNWLRAGASGHLSPYLTKHLQVYADKAHNNIVGLREYLKELSIT